MESGHKLHPPCASKEEFQRWVTSHFKQEKKVVKLVWGPVTQDSGSEEVTFTAYAYCKQHVTQENEPCKVSWKVEWKEGMMQVARIADQVDGLAGPSAHAPLPRMVKGVSASHRLQIKTTGADTPMRTLASFCEEHGGAQNVLTVQALRSPRKKFQR